MHLDPRRTSFVIRGRLLGIAAVLLLSAGIAATASAHTANHRAMAVSRRAANSQSYLAQVKNIVKGGESAFLWDPNSDLAGPISPSQMQVLHPGEWRGPTSAPKAAKGKKIEVISCAAGSACDGAAEGVEDAAKALGWKVHYSASDGTPSGDVRAFDAAIARHPDAIVAVALSQAILGQPMAAAHKAGIKVVGIAVAQLQPPPNGYDVTAPAPEAAASQVQAWIAMANSGGHANIGYMWDTASGTLGQVLPILQKQVADCSGCSQVPAVNHAYATCSDPVQMSQLTSSLIERSPGLSYILSPYGCGVPGMVTGVKSSPNQNVRIISQNGEVEEVAAVHKGQLFADVGFSLNQMGWTGVDALVRLFANQKALPVQKEGVILHIFTQKNAPGSGNFNWAKAFPYEQEYKKAWGVG